MSERIASAPPRLARRALLGAAICPALAGGLACPAGAATSGLAVIGRDGWLFPLWDVSARFEPAALLSATQVMNEAAAALKAAGIAVAIALIPSKARTYRQFLPADARLPADVDKRYPAALAELRRSGALVPDLDTPFAAARGDAEHPLYFRSDTHWTPAGAEVAAVEFARRIKEAVRLPPAARRGTQLGQPMPTRYPQGDLVRWLPEDARAKYQAEQFPLREALAGGAASLLDDDAADVAVVGNSFVQPKYGFVPLLSNQLDRPVSLAWKGNNFGPFVTMLEYLKGPVFRKQRPKLLVWAVLETDSQNLPNSSSWGQNGMTPQAFTGAVRAALGQ